MRFSLSSLIPFISLLAFLLLPLCVAPTLRAADGPDYLTSAAGAWASDPGYKVATAAGVATLSVGKQVMWAGQQLALAQPLDISAHPYLTVQVLASDPMVLDMYVLTGKAAFNVPRRIRAVPTFQTYGFDFSGVKNFDGHHITAVIFCVNGAATSWVGTVQLKNLQLGDQASLLPGLEAVEDQEWYHDTGSHTALLTGIDHVHGFTLSGAEQLLRNATFTAVTPEGTSTLRYDLIPGASGRAQATITATGDDGYGTLTRDFSVLVEDNLPPTIDQHPPLTAVVGKPLAIRFTGVSDGNPTAYQPLTITATSSNASVLASSALSAANPNGSRYIDLTATPLAPGDTTITLTLDDQSGKVSTTTTTLALHAVAQWNNPPTLDPITDIRGYVAGGDQQTLLSGISDGDQGAQHLTFTAVSSDPTIVPDPTVVAGAHGSATLHFSPSATAGKATITVTVTDDGGTAANNGNQSVSQAFVITTRVRPVDAYTLKVSDLPPLKAEDGVVPSADTLDGAPVLKIACTNKFTFAGLWLTLPDMDLSQAPCLSVDVKCDQKISFNLYFWDDAKNRNDGATRTTSIGGPGSDWQTVTFDFTGKGQMSTNKSVPIDSKCITQALFNFHPTFGWPFSNWTGTLYFRNLRIGTVADLPKRAPIVAIDALPAQVLPQGSGATHLTITGLTVANHALISLTASESGATQVSPVLGSVTNGSADLTLTAGSPGRSTVSVTATAPGADPTTITLTVDVVDTGSPGALTIDTDKTFQTMRGFGTFFGPDVGLYAKDLGASVMRVGDECDFNPRKDTSDLNVLNRDRLNYKAFDFSYFRAMKAAGVETFFFTAWTPPSWQKANFSTNYQGAAGFGDSNACLNRLDYDLYDDYAKTLVALVRMFQEEAGITLDAISLQNEPCFCEPYGSGILDPAHMVKLIDIVGPRFAKEGITTRILMPEQVFTQGNMLDYIRVLNADPIAQKYCSIVATHGYDDKGVIAASPDFPSWTNMFNLAQQGAGPKELWMSETYPEFKDWSSAMNYSMTLYGSLEYGNISLWTQWSIEGTLLDHNLPTDSFWVVRQYWKFIRPGAKRVSSSSSEASVFTTSYLNDAKHGGKLVSVITNHKDTPALQRIQVSGHSVASWQVVTTDPVRHGVVTGVLKAGAVLLLPPNSVTTLIEQ